jgi:hypothetical protein
MTMPPLYPKLKSKGQTSLQPQVLKLEQGCPRGEPNKSLVLLLYQGLMFPVVGLLLLKHLTGITVNSQHGCVEETRT